MAEQPTVTSPSYEWETLRGQVNDLRNEVERLKQEVQQLKNTKSAASPKQASTTTVVPTAPATQQSAPAVQQASMSFDPNAITLVNYTHDWVQSKASVSFKNNSSRLITQV